MGEVRLNIGRKGNKTSSLSGAYAPRPLERGIHDGGDGTPDIEMLRSSERAEYLNGYQCGFRGRKAPPWPHGEAWMEDSFIAMHEARYPHYIPPPMA